MPRSFTAEELVAVARQQTMTPDTGALGTGDQDILDWINEWFFDELIGAIVEVKEEYFHVSKKTSLDGSTYYRINPRAMYNKLRDLRLVNSGGGYSTSFRQIVPGKVQGLGGGSDSSSSSPSGFWIEGDYIRIWPGGANSGSLEQVFSFRPGELVFSTAARRIQSISDNTVTLTEAAPIGWTTANTFDCHSPLSGAEIKFWDKAATTVSATTITFAAAINGTITGERVAEVNDYITLTNEAALPGVPIEFHPLLGRAGACAIAEALGDTEELQVHLGRLREKMRMSLKHLEPRVDGKKKRIVGTPFISMHGKGSAYG